MQRRVSSLLAALLLLGIGCAKKLEGPAPTPTRADPGAVCQAQVSTRVTLSGEGFSPLYTGALTKQGQLELPQVSLTRVQDLSGASTSDAAIAIPDDPSNPSASHLHWQSQEQLAFDTDPALALSTGLYDVTVTNPNGKQGTLAGGLLAVPPPKITQAGSARICGSQQSTVVLTGDYFIRAGNVLPKVSFGSQTFDAASLTGCRALPGGAALQACTQLTVNVPAGALSPGTYPVKVQNPPPVPCASSETFTVTVSGGSIPALYFVDPETIYNGVTIQATLYGSGFNPPVQGVTATPSAGGADTSLPVQSASSVNKVQVLVPKGMAAGSYDVTITDNEGCSANLKNAFSVSAETSLTLATPAVSPSFGAQGRNTGITLSADTTASAGFVPLPRVYFNPTNPGPGTVASPLGAVSYVDAGHLTALVPETLPAGKYDVIVVNPDGKVGYAAAAFQLVGASEPPPRISSLSPGSVSNGGGVSVTVVGADFRSPQVGLTCFDQAGAPATAPTVTMGAPTATALPLTLGSTSAAACVVRVTNTDNNTYDDFSALVFTNPAKNLYAAQNGPDLKTARRAPVVLGGDATSAARFLHVIGGDDGTGAATDTVETSSLSLLGVPSAFSVQRNKLTTPRTFAGGVQIGRWLYVAGGSNGGTALDTVERAFVLDPARRTLVTDLALDVSTTNGLAAGLYYYRVAAVMGSSDPFNPGGEELPSDPFPVRLPNLGTRKLDVTLTWKAVPGATGYIVYRSPVAGTSAGGEQKIHEVSGGAVTTYQDTGDAPIVDAPTPLPVGSIGTWKQLPFAMSVAREGAGVTWAVDPGNPQQAYLYVLGGRSSASTARDTYEYVPVVLASDGTQPLGTVNGSGVVTAATAFTVGANTIGTARWQMMATAATHELAPIVPAGTTYIYAMSGVNAAGTSLVSNVTVAQVGAGGALGTFAAASSSGVNRAGYVGLVAAGQVYAFGGNSASPDASIASGNINGPPGVQNWNTGQTMNTPRYLAGGVLHGAYIYIAGGVSTSGVVKSVEYRIW